jgi:hypothetical protein
MATAIVAFPHRQDPQRLRAQQVVDDRGFARTRKAEQNAGFFGSETGRQRFETMAEPGAHRVHSHSRTSRCDLGHGGFGVGAKIGLRQ